MPRIGAFSDNVVQPQDTKTARHAHCIILLQRKILDVSSLSTLQLRQNCDVEFYRYELQRQLRHDATENARLSLTSVDSTPTMINSNLARDRPTYSSSVEFNAACRSVSITTLLSKPLNR